MSGRSLVLAGCFAVLCLGGFGLRATETISGTSGIPAEMTLGPLPATVPEPEHNRRSSAKEALGRALFFDPILSSTRTVSCATCHDPRFGWADGRATPIGIGAVGDGPSRTFQGSATVPVLAVNTPTLLNVGFNGILTGRPLDPVRAPMFWDARVQGLERQALVPLRTLGEMRGEDVAEQTAVDQAVQRLRVSETYRAQFQGVFGGTPEFAVTGEHLAEALAAFERSLVTAPAPIDRYLQGDAQALTADQMRGLRTFQTAGCMECHGGPMFSDYALHVLGVPEANAPAGRAFRTPTLRNLRSTAPYMHNGSLATVRDLLVFYEALEDTVSETLDGGDSATQPHLDPRLQKLRLTPEDFPYLEAFFVALEGEDRSLGAPASRPTEGSRRRAPQLPSGKPRPDSRRVVTEATDSKHD